MLRSSSTVLYVEDDESDRFFMQLAFASLGLESAFFTVPDGRIAIDQGERRWSFTPTSPWAAGSYPVWIASSLEDVCGNSFAVIAY